MRPSTDDRMRRGGNRRRYDENSGYFNFRYWARGGEVAAGGERSARRSDGRANRQQNRPDSGCGLRFGEQSCPVKHETRFLLPDVFDNGGQMIIASSSIIPSPITSTATAIGS